MNRTTTGLLLAALLSTGSLAGAATAAPVAPAAPAASLVSAAPRAALAPQAWADFQQPDPWLRPSDSLHWYVTTPVVTKAMVGKQARFVVTSPRTLDCTAVGGGYAVADEWRNVSFTTKKCTATRATVTMKVDAAMVGSRVSLIGWTATTAKTATISSQVTVGKKAYRTKVTASRTDAVAPVGPGVAVGTWQGKEVMLASQATVNEVWVGGKRFAAPSGDVLKAVLQGNLVHVLVKIDADSLVLWHLDLATGKATTQDFDATVVEVGAPGFMIDVIPSPTVMPRRSAYSWDGVERYGRGARQTRMVGFSKSYLVHITGGQLPQGVELKPMADGQQGVASPSYYRWVENVRVDPATDVVAYTVRLVEEGKTQECTLSPAGAVCGPVQG